MMGLDENDTLKDRLHICVHYFVPDRVTQEDEWRFFVYTEGF